MFIQTLALYKSFTYLFTYLLTESINTDNIFNGSHDINTLQQAQITELTETMFHVSIAQMNDQQ